MNAVSFALNIQVEKRNARAIFLCIPVLRIKVIVQPAEKKLRFAFKLIRYFGNVYWHVGVIFSPSCIG